MIYLAGKYSAPTATERTHHFMTHQRVAVQMLKAGLHPYSPIVHWHPTAVLLALPTDSDFWKEHNRAMLQCAIALWVIPGWEGSRGTEFEIDVARKLGLPIRFLAQGPDGQVIL